MPIFTSADDITGSAAADLIVGVGSGNGQSITAGNGDDAVIAGHGPVIIDDVPTNNSLATALNIDDAANWAIGSNPFVANEGTPHATILGLGEGANDWFAVTLGAGEVLTVDVDFANSQYGTTQWDSQVQIVNSSGTQVAAGDDGPPDQGGMGSFRYNIAINATRDAYVTYTAAAAGTYYINLGTFGGALPTTIVAGRAYLLNVSVTGHAATGSVLQNAFNAIDGGEGSDYLVGATGGDAITGGAGALDYLYGMGGDDSLEGGEGDDYIDGSYGFDRATYANAAGGVSVSLSAVGQQAVGGGQGSDTLVGVEALGGSAFDDTLTGDGNTNYLRGLGGIDNLNGMGGNDVLEVLDGTGHDNLDGGEGYDTLDLSNATIGWTLNFNGVSFTNGTDTLSLTGIEAVGGSQAADIVYAPAGAAFDFNGNGGDDVYYYSAVVGGSFDGGEGVDRLDFSHMSLSGIYLADLASGFDSNGLNIANVENVTTDGTTDQLIGNDRDNVFRSGASADFLDGRGGNDTLEGGTGDDVLDGGEGFDWASYESAGSGVTVTLATTLSQNTGGAGSDTLTFIEALIGSAYNDSLTGNDLDNWFEGEAGNDTVVGGAGNDTFFWEEGGNSDNFNGGDSTTGDILYLLRADSGWMVNLGIGIASNFLSGSVLLSSVEQVYGSDYADDLTANNGGGSTLYGFGGDDVIRIANSTPNTAFGGDGIDTLVTTSVVGVGLNYVIDLAAGASNFGETIAEFENLVSGETNDTVTGTDGANIIETQNGNDTVEGGDGDDVLDGGVGIDTASYASAASGVTVSLAILTSQATGGAGSDTLAGFENLIGSAFADQLIGSTGLNRLDGGLGADWLEGGADNDTYVVDDAGDTVIELNGEGTDTVESSVSFNLSGQYIEVLTLTGSGNINAIGNTKVNTLVGNAGNNLLNGGSSADTMRGGAGNDRYIVDNAGDTVTELKSEGTDTVESSVSFNLSGQYVEVLKLTGSGHIDATGNNQVNTLNGNAGNNLLNGGGDADAMRGGAGNDRYIVDNAGDTVTELKDEGTDTVESSVSFSLSGQYVEVLTLTGSGNVNATGNNQANTLIGNAGNNVLNGVAGNDMLNGGTGADTMVGGTGNDRYIVDNAGDKVTELKGEGTDTVESSVSFSLTGQYVEVLTLTGNGNVNATGNTKVNTLVGNAGNNVLNGGGDADAMRGAAGDDRYIVDNAGDVVNELKNEGTDTVESSVSFSLTGQYVEVLTLTGSGNINATGNNQANTLNGNAGNNVLTAGGGNDTLNGGLGADTMVGGTGNDRFIVDNAGDKVTELKSEGTDTVESSVSFNLSGQYVEVLTLTGSGNINATGNNQANTLIGNSGNNVLTAGGGNDTLNGGTGADTLIGGTDDDRYVVDNAGDTVTELNNEGTDTVESSVSFNLSGQYVEMLTLTGSDNIDATGNNQANTLVGNAGNNLLNGGGKADTLTGGTGADSFQFSSALGAGNVDTITDYSVADDRILLDNADFTGLAAGVLNANAFHTGAAATDASDRIIYNSATGALLFDADGVGGAAAVQFATLTAGLAMTNTEFLVI